MQIGGGFHREINDEEEVNRRRKKEKETAETVCEEEEAAQRKKNNYKYVYLESEHTRLLKNFKVRGKEARFTIREPKNNIVSQLERAFREIYDYVIDSLAENDYVGIAFDSENLSHGPVGISFRMVRDLSPDDIWNLVSSEGAERRRA